MSLIVEDGTGLAYAESYLSIEDASAYAKAHGSSFPINASDEAEAALRRATAWVDAKYRNSFPGYRTNGRSQALQWPRLCAYDVEGELIESNVIPDEIINATAEAAIREYVSPFSLAPDLAKEDYIRQLSAGPVSITFSDAPSQNTTYQVIDQILSTLINSGSIYSGSVVRG